MKKVHLVIFCKTNKKGSDKNPYLAGGLSANALHTVGVLSRVGVNCELRLVNTYDEVSQFLKTNNNVTHVVIEAIWMTIEQIEHLAMVHFEKKFVVRVHSKIGFLQCEPEAIPTMRRIICSTLTNVALASNNEEFADSLYEVYGKTLHLPNLYDLPASPPKITSTDGILRIASFGATRLLKMHPNAALAAMQVAHRLNRTMNFYINLDSTPGGDSVRNTMRNLLAQTEHRLIEVPWQDPDTFKKTISAMDLVLQLSSTETFCLVAADAIASGVPVVVGPAITWLSGNHQASIDNTDNVASVAVATLKWGGAVKAQQKQLNKFISDSRIVWLNYLELPSKKRSWWR